MEQPTTSAQRADKPDDAMMFSLIEEQQRSGLTVKVFCGKQGITPHSFYYWMKKYRNRHPTAVDKKSRFTRLQLPDEAPGTLFCEVVTATGGRLRFYQPVPAAYLQSLL